MRFTVDYKTFYYPAAVGTPISYNLSAYVNVKQ